MSLEFVNINDNIQYKKQVKNLYISSFPKEERAPFGLMKIYARRKSTDFYCIYDNEIFVGLTYILHDDTIAYVSYLAINSELRGQGYGSKVLSYLKDKYKGKKIILAIEPVTPDSNNYEERVNRKKFYNKNGFYEMNFNIFEMGEEFEILGYDDNGRIVSVTEFETFISGVLGRLVFKLVYKTK